MTQNVDGLHQRAGSARGARTAREYPRVVCLDCHAQLAAPSSSACSKSATPPSPAPSPAPRRMATPTSSRTRWPSSTSPIASTAAALLKPDVVFFGDGVAPAATQQALALMEAADALLVVGSSLMVFSGFRFCRMAAAAGKPIAAINLGITRADDLLTLKIDGSAERLLPALRDSLTHQGHAMKLTGLMLAALLLGGCVGKPDNVTPVAHFDSAKYLGKWYEIARLDHSFERGL